VSTPTDNSQPHIRTPPSTLGLPGLALITSFETLQFTAYLPTPNDVWTIGYGHTHNVKQGDTCTSSQANKWLIDDVNGAVTDVRIMLAEINLTQSMFDALVSLVFNVGSGAIIQWSTIRQALAGKDYYAACAGFYLWRKQAGKDLLGLARRRVKEMELFLSGGLP
jgi:lysozyme